MPILDLESFVPNIFDAFWMLPNKFLKYGGRKILYIASRIF